MRVAKGVDPWIFAQIGARQRYFVPRALQAVGALEMLMTDAWYAPGHPLAHADRLKDRFNPALANAQVWAPNRRGLAIEALHRLRRDAPIQHMMARNAWFQRAAVHRLARVPDRPNRVLSSFSYAARDLFVYAKARGWKTVLNQIDPGAFEEALVQRLPHTSPQPSWPTQYWENWRAETELADKIVVNSEWSRQALVSSAVPTDKIHVIPLVFDGIRQDRPARSYPAAFTTQRPVRVLFLGQVIVRKGVLPLFEAIRRMPAATPIHFDFVGPIDVAVPADIASDPRVSLHGSVPQAQTDSFYETSDVFILPTYSDGFGVTQIEARAMRLPIIASRYCGDVVRDGVNGLLIDSVTPEAICEALLQCANDPAMLTRMSAAEDDDADESAIGRHWITLFGA